MIQTIGDYFYRYKKAAIGAANVASAAYLIYTNPSITLRSGILLSARVLSQFALITDHTLVKCAASFANAMNLCSLQSTSSALSLGGYVTYSSTASQSQLDTILSVFNMLNFGWPSRLELSDAATLR